MEGVRREVHPFLINLTQSTAVNIYYYSDSSYNHF
jgi:hypothetical protein